jgi:hypothetical protein
MSEQTIEQPIRELSPPLEPSRSANGDEPETLERDVDLMREKGTFALEVPVTIDGKTYSEVTFDFLGTPSAAFEKVIKTWRRLHPDDDTVDMFKSEEFQQMLVSRVAGLPMAVIQAFDVWDRMACQQKAYVWMGKRLAMKAIRVG